MAVPILSMQFDSTGCTNKKVKNLGGISFNSSSCVGKKNLRAAYFQPYHASAGFEIVNDEVRAIIESGKAWSIYFKYKVDKVTKYSLPILTYREEDEWNTKNLITLENRKSIIIKASKYSTYFTRSIDYTFDDKWHTFYLMYDEEHTLRIMIDGQLLLNIYEADIFDFSRHFYIGYSISDGETSTLDGWYIDDFNIFKDCLYKDEFIPPTEYIGGNDVLSNYYDKSVANIDNMEEEIKDSIEKNREHSISFINEMQLGWLPRRLRFNWHEEHRGYFKDHHYNMISNIDSNTYINVEGVDQPLLTGRERYYEATLETALESGKVLPMMIFINGEFRRLSKIRIVKSDDYYCFIFTDRSRFTSDKVTSFEIILLPFPIIYEEDYGERADQSPLYVFSRDGKFDPVHGHTFYYVDQERLPQLKHIGIREQLLPNDTYIKNKTEEEKVELADKSYMKFAWRYGTLDLKRVDDNGGGFMLFRSDDYSWIKPGDNVILYSGTVVIDPSLYEIVGYDLIYFEDLEKANVRSDRTITMQIVTDSQDPKQAMLFQDLTNLEMVTATATSHNQSVFKIPDLTDGDGVEWKKFLLFKGHTFMENDKRYTIDYDAGTIRLNDPKDFMPKGRSLLFAFIKIKKADSRGNLYVKPIFLYSRPTNGLEATISTIDDKIKITKSNVMLFRNNTFVNPTRYEIIDNTLRLNEDEIPFDSNTSLIFVMLKMISPTEDTSGWRNTMINQEIEKGYRFVLYDIGISKKIKITIDNFLCFDEDGTLITDLKGYVYDLNIIKRLSTLEPLERRVRYLTCLYRTDFLENEDNALLPLNDTFMREYLKGRQEYYEMDSHFNELMKEFNFHHRSDLTYGENLSRSFNYILSYNQNKLDDAYDKRATASRRVYNTLGLNQSMMKGSNNEWLLSIPRNQYKQNVSRTYPMFFQNGKLASWNANMEEINNDVIVTLPSKLSADDKIESIDFHNMSNFLIPLQNVVKSDKRATLTIPAHMVTGNEFNYEIDSTLTIKDGIDLEFLATIEIPQGFDYIESKNPFGMDIFTSTIKVICKQEKWFSATIKVIEEPKGIEVDLDHFNMNYDFFSRVEVLANEEV